MKKIVLFFSFAFVFIPALFADEAGKYQLGLTYGYQFLNSDISSFTVNQNAYTASDIEQSNNDYDFKTMLHTVGLTFNYLIIDEITAEVGGGLSFLKHETYNQKNGSSNLDFIFSNNDPGYYVRASVGVKYSIMDKLDLLFIPEINYYQLRNLHGIDSDENQNTSQNVIHQNQLSWKVGLIVSYTFNMISPFLGAEYHDFRQNVDFDGYVTDVFNDQYFMERDIVYKQKTPFALRGGFDIIAIPGKHFIVEGTIGAGYSITIKLVNHL